MAGTAAFLRNGRLDVLAANQLGDALYAPAFLDPVRPVNLARFVFLDSKSTEFYGDWDGIAHDVDYHRGGAQPFRHPLVGDLTLDDDVLELPADPGLSIVAYTAEAGPPARHALDLLTADSDP